MDTSQSTAANPLLEWQELLTEISRLEAPAPASEEDEPCACGRAGKFVCDTCPNWLCCEQCVLLTHKKYPLHWIQEWTGSHFQRRSLRDMGMRVLLGHSGLECPVGRAKCVKVTTDEGVVPVEVVFCDCDPITHSMQLLRELGWATTSQSDTCVFVAGLRRFLA
ncbi:hypothetical protein C8R44DRAFT_896597 [Mycena epipterygia]|nr:hypothetical protein C8R44DRAFT_896597 [Mycena epipterygia]